MASPQCDSIIHLCRIRVTRLDAVGNPAAGPNNTYVTDKPMMLTVKPVIEAGEDKTLVGGCDCIVALYRGYDKLKYFNLELDLAVMEPGLIEMITGASVILDGSGSPIGLSWANQLACGNATQPNVVVEAWSDLWENDHQSAVYPYVHWVFPSSYWQIADFSLQNDFMQPKLSGFTRSNPNWGLGIYHDYPQAIGNQGGFFYTATVPPAAVCGYQSHTLT